MIPVRRAVGRGRAGGGRPGNGPLGRLGGSGRPWCRTGRRTWRRRRRKGEGWAAPGGVGRRGRWCALTPGWRARRPLGRGTGLPAGSTRRAARVELTTRSRSTGDRTHPAGPVETGSDQGHDQTDDQQCQARRPGALTERLGDEHQGADHDCEGAVPRGEAPTGPRAHPHRYRTQADAQDRSSRCIERFAQEHHAQREDRDSDREQHRGLAVVSSPVPPRGAGQVGTAEDQRGPPELGTRVLGFWELLVELVELVAGAELVGGRPVEARVHGGERAAGGEPVEHLVQRRINDLHHGDQPER